MSVFRGHRGRKGEPLYQIRKLLLCGVERLDTQAFEKLCDTLRRIDTDGDISECWEAKELVRDVYLAAGIDDARRALDAAIAWCEDSPEVPELVTLAKTLRRWYGEILAHHNTGASNGKVEAANLKIKQVKRSGRGFRNFWNYRTRILLAGHGNGHTGPVTTIRSRTTPSSDA